MKNIKNRKSLLITSIIIVFLILGFIVLEKGADLFKGLDLLVLVLIVVLAVFSLIKAFKKDKDERVGLKTEDELSTQIKYKAGYYTFLISIYMWLIISIMENKFPDTETTIGFGLIMSALIFFISHIIIKELRARNNITQLELAKLVKVRRETIVFLEKGKYNPSLKLAYDVSKVFNKPIEDVFLFKE